MTLRKIASEICKREGKKSQARIGDVREILGILSDIVYEDSGLTSSFWQTFDDNGRRRAKKKK